MTKQEAINLESECEKLLSDALGRECTVSMVVTGNLKVEFGGNCVSISKDDFFTPVYIGFHGSCGYLEKTIKKIQKVFSENVDKFKLLLESYHMNFDDDQNYKEVRKIKQCW